MRLKLDESPFKSVPPAVDAGGRYRPVSFWQQNVSVTPGEPLREQLDCDVAIIGGGYTGLSVAFELKQAAPDLEIALLERSVVGHGASGRNGGFVMPLIGWDLSDAVRKLGQQGARRAYQLMYDAVAHLKSLVAEHQLDCDLESTGYLLLSTAPRRDRHVEKEAELGRKLGFQHQFLDAHALREHVRSDSFRCGVFDPHPAILNPAKLARGLKALAERVGVRVYEQTPLVELRDGDAITLTTPQGRVHARAVVLAVNGYGAALGFMPARIVPVHTYIVLTEPLDSRQLESIGWSARRTSLETARNFIHYFRLTADNRIAFGGEDAKLYWGGRYRDADPCCFGKLEARFREYFPSLSSTRFTHRWGGVLGVTLDMFPTFGAGGREGTIFHAAGYSGHGVALSNYAGRILAPRILCRLGRLQLRDIRDEPFFHGRQPPWLPPDPVRWLGLQGYRAILRAGDRWRER
jgi:glycine/D-amino acid oxidase-like deaminating enzyme